MVTASVSTKASVRSARTWQPADTARAASPASTEIRPTGAAASVSIRGPFGATLNQTCRYFGTRLHLTCQYFTVHFYVSRFPDSSLHRKAFPGILKIYSFTANADSQSVGQQINCLFLRQVNLDYSHSVCCVLFTFYASLWYVHIFIKFCVCDSQSITCPVSIQHRYLVSVPPQGH